MIPVSRDRASFPPADGPFLCFFFFGFKGVVSYFFRNQLPLAS